MGAGGGGGRGWGLLAVALASVGVSMMGACTYDVPGVLMADPSGTDAGVRDAGGQTMEAGPFDDGGPDDTSVAGQDDTSVGVDSGQADSVVTDTGPSDGAAPVDGTVTDGTAGDGTVGPACTGAIAWKETTQFTGSVTTVVLPAPHSIAAGDLLLAYVTSSSDVATAITFTPPVGWSMAGGATQQGYYLGTAMLDVYVKFAGASEPTSYSWTVSRKAESEAWILDYTNVDQASPIDTHAAAGQSVLSTSFATPNLTTVGTNEMLIATFASTTEPPATGWATPSLLTQRVTLADGNSMASASYDKLKVAVGAVSVPTSFPQGVTSADINTVLTHIIALRPCP